MSLFFKHLDKLIALDPGWITGYAIFADDKKQTPPLSTGLLRAPKGDWKTKIIGLAMKLDGILEKDPSIAQVIAEMPAYWEDSNRGKVAAEKQFLTHLACLVGAYGGVSLSRGRRFLPVDVREWKGQMSKFAVDKRIERRICMEFPNHIGDAVGVGLWVQKQFSPVDETKETK